ncbi:hypothetical protein TKK_0012361 [Trichogramma kaykai]
MEPVMDSLMTVMRVCETRVQAVSMINNHWTLQTSPQQAVGAPAVRRSAGRQAIRGAARRPVGRQPVAAAGAAEVPANRRPEADEAEHQLNAAAERQPGAAAAIRRPVGRQPVAAVGAAGAPANRQPDANGAARQPAGAVGRQPVAAAAAVRRRGGRQPVAAGAAVRRPVGRQPVAAAGAARPGDDIEDVDGNFPDDEVHQPAFPMVALQQDASHGRDFVDDGYDDQQPFYVDEDQEPNFEDSRVPDEVDFYDYLGNFEDERANANFGQRGNFHSTAVVDVQGLNECNSRNRVDSAVDPFSRLANVLERSLLNNSSSGNNDSVVLSRMTTDKNLPRFSGDPLHWRRFKNAFENSTSIGNFSQRENMTRLYDALRDEALEAVKTSFVACDDAEAVMKVLELRFGSPKLILNALLECIRKLPSLIDEPNRMIEFATSLNEAVKAMKSVQGSLGYLHSQELVAGILDKQTSI